MLVCGGVRACACVPCTHYVLKWSPTFSQRACTATARDTGLTRPPTGLPTDLGAAPCCFMRRIEDAVIPPLCL